MLNILKEDKNIFLHSSPHNFISIFDHTHYDRSDIDLLSAPQRKYIEKKLKKFGYKFKTGRLLISKDNLLKFRIPKQSIISANPFDIIRNEKRDEGDFLILTPTQAACLIITKESNSEAILKNLKLLIEKQPINLKKILDNSRFEKTKEIFVEIYPELVKFQKEIIENSNLKSKGHLGKFF